jgi:hypothetical protein
MTDVIQVGSPALLLSETTSNERNPSFDRTSQRSAGFGCCHQCRVLPCAGHPVRVRVLELLRTHAEMSVRAFRRRSKSSLEAPPSTSASSDANECSPPVARGRACSTGSAIRGQSDS